MLSICTGISWGMHACPYSKMCKYTHVSQVTNDISMASYTPQRYLGVAFLCGVAHGKPRLYNHLRNGVLLKVHIEVREFAKCK